MAKRLLPDLKPCACCHVSLFAALQDETSSRQLGLSTDPDLLIRQQQLRQRVQGHSQYDEPSLVGSNSRGHDLFNNMPAASGASYGARQPSQPHHDGTKPPKTGLSPTAWDRIR